jgi:hypothetical protein
LVFITVVESVYSAVRTDSLYKADYVSPLKDKLFDAKHRLYMKPKRVADVWRPDVYISILRFHISKEEN